MRNKYITPHTQAFLVPVETLLATSVLERGEGTGGNVAEIKGQINSDEDSGDWNIWE